MDYAEGTRSKDGRLGRFKSGFAHLAMRTGYPIVPIAIHGASTVEWYMTCARVRSVQTLSQIPTDDWTDGSVREQVKHVRHVI